MKKIFFITTLLILAIGCQKENDNNPEEEGVIRTTNKALQNELTASQEGWKLTYAATDGSTGAYQFLLKFAADGSVTMTSDISATTTPTVSQYTTQEDNQGLILSFVGQNYLQQLAEAVKGEAGKGLSGRVYQFLYTRKEGHNLLFKNLLNNNPATIGFEPATANDWNSIKTLADNLSPITKLTDNYYLKVSDATSSTIYPIRFDNRVLTVSNTTVAAPAKATTEGLAFLSPLTIAGKSFNSLTRSGSVATPTYRSDNENTAIELFYSAIPLEVLNSNDYEEIASEKLYAFSILSSLRSSSYMSNSFYDSFFVIDSEKNFVSINLSFKANNKAEVRIGYKFPNKTQTEYLTANTTYELRNKRIYLTLENFKRPTASWTQNENRALLDLAFERLENFIVLANEGLYLRNTGEKYARYDIYYLQSHKFPNVHFPAYALKH